MSQGAPRASGNRCSLAVLVRRARHKGGDGRLEIARLLDDLRNPAARETFHEMLTDASDRVRLAAAAGLAHLGEPDALLRLADSLIRSTNWQVREHLATALERAAEPATSTHLLELLASGYADTRQIAARGLARLASPQAVTALRQALDAEVSSAEAAQAQADALLALDRGHDQQALKRLLRSQNRWWVYFAARSLLESGHREGIAALVKLAGNADGSRIRSASIAALMPVAADIPPPRLNALTRDGNSETRSGAAHVLASSGGDVALTLLAELAKDDLWEVREQSAAALARVEGEPSRKLLTRLLRDEDDDVRAAALRSAAVVMPDSTRDLALRWLEATDVSDALRRAACAWFGRLGGDSRVLAQLQALTRDESAALRAASVTALEGFAAGDTSGTLVAAFDDPDWRVQLAAARVIEGQGEEAVDCLIATMEACEDEEQLARLAWVLDKLGDPRKTRPVLLARGRSLPLVWSAAAQAAVQARDRSVLQPIVDALVYRDPRIREQAAAALGDLGDQERSGALIDLLDDPAWDVRVAAGTALGKIAHGSPERLVEELLHRGRNRATREGIVRVLGYIADKTTVQGIVRALSDPGRLVRATAADALGAIGDPSAVEPLIQATRDDDYGVRNAAGWALRKIGGREALAAVGAWTRARHNQVREGSRPPG